MIYSGLQSQGIVRPSFDDDLEVLPLQDIPDLPTLQQEDLVRRCADAQVPGDLPT